MPPILSNRPYPLRSKKFSGAVSITTQADYTDTEWKILLMAPLSAGFALAMSDFGLISTEIEGYAMNKELTEAVQKRCKSILAMN